MKISEKIIGHFDGAAVTAYTLTNQQGLSLTAMTYGAAITALNVPDKNGSFENIVLAMDSLEDYITYRPYYGATIGRVAGRISNGRFVIDHKEYHVDKNTGSKQLHGGSKGFDTQNWNAVVKQKADEASIIFSYQDKEGTNGYPGTVDATVTYTLTDKNEWKITYGAATDKPTLFNPTNHVYFNLTGDLSKNVLDHTLKINSSKIVELNAETLPTGRLLPVEGTPFDLRDGKKLSIAAENRHPQTIQASGFDHAFVLDHTAGEADAILTDDTSGRVVKMYTDQDSAVVFIHNGAIDSYTLQGKKAGPYIGVTMETQAFPDAINQKDFGDIILRPEKPYHAETVFSFEIK